MKEWAVVTGGSRNIGAAIAKRLLEDGFEVMVASRTPPEHDDFTEYVEIDLEDPDAAAATLKDATGDRKVTRFVHNAAISNVDHSQKLAYDDMLRVFSVNAAAFVTLSQVVVPIMQEAGVGRIVVIGSRASLGKALRTAYSGSKAALSGIVRTMAIELGGDGITVNMVSPGPIETSMFRKATVPGSLDYINLNKGLPVGFIGDPADIAHSVSYFLSDGARFVTGQELFVCGGASVGFVSPEGRDVDHKFAGEYPAKQ